METADSLSPSPPAATGRTPSREAAAVSPVRVPTPWLASILLTAAPQRAAYGFVSSSSPYAIGFPSSAASSICSLAFVSFSSRRLKRLACYIISCDRTTLDYNGHALVSPPCFAFIVSIAKSMSA